MGRRAEAIVLALAGTLAAVTAFGRSEPLAQDCPRYEQRIDALARAIGQAGSAQRNEMNGKYANFVRELDRLDANTRFRMCTDQDGAATLKFDTPEETLRDSIGRILGWVSWFNGKLPSLAGAGERVETDAVLTKVQGNLGNIETAVNKRKTAGLTLKGDYETVAQEYTRLKKMRRESIDNLKHVADRFMCHGLTAEEMELAELYHDTIPNNRACNPLLRKALRDRIRRVRTIGFGSIFDLATYRRMKAECRVGRAAGARPASVVRPGQQARPAARAQPDAGCAALYTWWQTNQCDHWGREGKLFIPQEKWAIHDQCFSRWADVNRCAAAGHWSAR